MKKDFLIAKLKAAGLIEKEAQVYLSSLELGHAPASRIAQNAGMNRVTVYGILEDLCARGYIERSEKAGIKHYLPISPEILLSEAKQRTNSLAETVPFLMTLQGQSEFKPQVRVFEGLQQVKKAYELTLASQTEILNFANTHEIRKFWPEYEDEYIAKRREKQIYLRGLYPDDGDGHEVQERDAMQYRETRLIDPQSFSAENEIKIFDNHVLIVSFAPQTFAILIESSTVYETQKQIFEMLWQVAKRKKIWKRA